VIFWFAILGGQTLVSWLSAGRVLLNPSDRGAAAVCLVVVRWHMSLHYLMLCYTCLHICCGLELALDSFGLRFFKEVEY